MTFLIIKVSEKFRKWWKCFFANGFSWDLRTEDIRNISELWKSYKKWSKQKCMSRMNSFELRAIIQITDCEEINKTDNYN